MEQDLSSPTKFRTYNIFRKIYSSIIVRLILILVIILSFCFYLTFSSTQAHSESDVKYRQVSLVLGTSSSEQVSVETKQENEQPKFKKIDVSYEVDMVTPTPTPIVVTTNSDIWIKLAQCESKQNWSIDTGNGYYGGLQFTLGAWASVGGSGKPSDASKEEQIMRGQMLQQRRGWSPWGACSKKLGLL